MWLVRQLDVFIYLLKRRRCLAVAMKCVSFTLLAVLSLSTVNAAAPNPVSRVAQLLKDLASKIDSELDNEESLYK